MVEKSAPTAKQPPEHKVGVMYCTNHPDRETYLRCNKCGRPMCIDCLVLTDVGYRCHDCIREQQNKFFTAKLSNITAAVVASMLEGIAITSVGIVLMAVISLWGLLLAPALGGLAAAWSWRAAGRQQARHLKRYTTAALLAGSIVLWGTLAIAGMTSLLTLLFLVIASVTFYNRMP